MEWLILFVTSWLLFFILVRWKEIKTNIWGGIVAISLQLLVDTHAMSHQLYHVDKIVLDVKIFGSSVLFVFGPVLIIGILFAQYHPKRTWLTVMNIFAFAMLYSFQEALLVSRHAVIYKNWHYLDSAVVNVFSMLILSWFSIVILGKRKKA